jgi:hypothetical protein
MYIRPLLLLPGSYPEMPLLLLNIPSPLEISWVYKASSELTRWRDWGFASYTLGITSQHHKTVMN